MAPRSRWLVEAAWLKWKWLRKLIESKRNEATIASHSLQSGRQPPNLERMYVIKLSRKRVIVNNLKGADRVRIQEGASIQFRRRAVLYSYHTLKNSH